MAHEADDGSSRRYGSGEGASWEVLWVLCETCRRRGIDQRSFLQILTATGAGGLVAVKYASVTLPGRALCPRASARPRHELW